MNNPFVFLQEWYYRTRLNIGMWFEFQLLNISNWPFVVSISNFLKADPRHIAKTILSSIFLLCFALVSIGVILVPNAVRAESNQTVTSAAYEACMNTPTSAVWLTKKEANGTTSVDYTHFAYPRDGGRLRIESAGLLRSILESPDVGVTVFAKNMVIAQADAWDSDQNLANGPFEAHVDLNYWQKFWIDAYTGWSADHALVYHDVICVDLPSKTQMASVVAASQFNSVDDMVARVPGFSANDFSRTTNPTAQLALRKVVELNCKNLRTPGSIKTETECVANFATTTLTGQELVKAITDFYKGIVAGTATAPAFPTIAVTQYTEPLNPTQIADFGTIYTNIVNECGTEDQRCIGQKWDQLAFTFSDEVITQINDRCSDLDYCRGLVVLYRGQGYDENTAVQMALQQLEEANNMTQSDECTWDEITSNSCVTGTVMYYVYNEGAGIDTALALDGNANIIDTISTITGVPFDTSRSHLVPIPTSSTLYGMFTDPYGNMKGGIIVSTSMIGTQNPYYATFSSMNGYDCYDKQAYHHQQVGSMWVYPSSVGRYEQCSPVIQPATPVPNNPTTLPPLEEGLVAQGASMSSSIALSMDCSNAMSDGNWYFQGSGYSLSIHNSYLPTGTCSGGSNNTIYIATSAGQGSVSVGTSWTLLSGETNLYWAKRWQ